MLIREITESRPIPISRSLATSPGRIMRNPLQARKADVGNKAVQGLRDAVDIKKIAASIAQGDWKTAIATGALNAIPRLKNSLTPKQFEMLQFAANTYSTVDFMSGMASYAASRGLPWLAGVAAPVAAGIGAATYSGGLNTGEEEELARRRQLPIEITKHK